MYKCNLCNYYGYMKVISKIEDRNILLCPNCKLQFMYPQTSDEELNKIYSSKNYPTCSFDNGIEENSITSMKRKTFNNILKKILPYCSSGKLLDIGCSSGLLLDEARLLGFEPYGIEISEYASNIAKKRIGSERIYNGTLETSNFNKNFFNVITMIDVIEHVRNPIETLKYARNILNNTGGGYILITTPNTYSFSNKIMGSKWTHYNSEHLFYFNKLSIKKLCDICGYELIYCSSFAKTMRLDYMSFQMKEHCHSFVSNLMNIVSNIPIIGKINFPIFTGDFIVILKIL